MRSSGFPVVVSALLFLSATFPSPAEDKPLPEAVQHLKQSYEQALVRSTALLQAGYEDQMNRPEQKYTQAGKLDEVLAIKAELAHARDPQAPSDPTKLPPEARQLVAQQQKAIAAAADPIRKSYVAELNRLLVESTRANRLDDAIAIRDELKTLPAGTTLPPLGSAMDTPLSGPAKSSIPVTNTTKAREGDAVFAAAQLFKPDLFHAIKAVELVGFHDFAEPPMKRNNGGAEHVPGEHAKTAWVSSGKGMIIWGDYDKLEPGEYIIVYRVRTYDAGPTDEVAFLDVAEGGNTKSGLHPKGADLPAGAWHEVPLALKVPEAKNYEFRLWESGKKLAMDRLYIFKVKN